MIAPMENFFSKLFLLHSTYYFYYSSQLISTFLWKRNFWSVNAHTELGRTAAVRLLGLEGGRRGALTPACKWGNIQCSLQRYHTEGAKIEEVDGFAMVTKMAANVEVMMQHKIESIKVNILGMT